MQQPVCHDQRAYSNGVLRSPKERRYFCQMITHIFLICYISHWHKTTQQTLKTGVNDFICSQCSTHIYLKFESYNYNLQSKYVVHKGVDFYVQNSIKLIYEHL